MEETRKQKIIKEVRSLTIIFVAVFAFRSVFFEPFRIPSGSMIPTLMIGDFIVVNKFSYGFRVPFSDVNLFGYDFSSIYMFGKKEPERGDVIVFKFPQDKSINYIKRVVGLPGDSIEIVDRRIYVNGAPYESESVPGQEIMADMDDKFKDYVFDFFLTKTGKHQHLVQQTISPIAIDTIPRFKVPAGQYFVMGDNRDFSMDSRYWGFVPFENIKGRAVLVWFSFIFPFSDNPMKLRLHRIGTRID